MTELELIPLLAAVWEELGIGGSVFVLFAVGAVICWIKGKPLISLFTGNGYIRQKDYDEDMRALREERLHARTKLDKVAQDLNELIGIVKGLSK